MCLRWQGKYLSRPFGTAKRFHNSLNAFLFEKSDNCPCLFWILCLKVVYAFIHFNFFFSR